MEPARGVDPGPSGSRIGIVGAGTIGASFAIVFARAGHHVRLYDPDPARRKDVVTSMAEHAAALHAYDLIAEAPAAILERIEIVASLDACVAGACYVQECAPERLELKRTLFATLGELAPADAILASSSSAIMASAIAEHLPHRDRVLIAHPGNPPTLIPVVEIVPAPFTDPAAVAKTAELLRSAGLSPLIVRREIEGFAFNRLQGALLREAYCLVRDQVVTVEEIDCLVRDGLGLRWSVVGPFETADLNTRGGITAHAAKMGPAYARMGLERGQDDPWTEAMVADVTAQRRALLPLDSWEQRVAWRDRRLMALLRMRDKPEAWS